MMEREINKKGKLKGFIFPGQGSQYIGMGKDFYQRYSSVKDIFEQASDVLKIDVKNLCFQGDEAILKETRYTQPLVFTVSFACFTVLKEKGIIPDIVAGHSLGEYTALVAGGYLDFVDGLKLVKKRGEVMQEVGGKHQGVMAAIIGLEKEKINKILEEAGRWGVVVAANFNSSMQIVISGEEIAVRKAKLMAEKEGAKRVVILKVGGAFHSPLMAEAKEKIRWEIEKVKIHSSNIPIVMNANAKILTTPQQIKEAMISQIISPVLWEDSVKEMVNAGVTTFIEVGPSKVLTGLVRQIARQSLVLHVEDEKSLIATKEKLNALS